MAALAADEILKELDRLWVSLGREAEGRESQGVVRACAMTLVVVADDTEDAAGIGQVVAQVMREHPNRTILVRVARHREAPLEARVTAQCWMPLSQRQQICCEQIEISVAEKDLADLRPLLLALSAPDLPVALWCRSRRVFETGLRQVWTGAGRWIVDSGAWGDARLVLPQLARAAGDASGPGLGDLSWTRITRWREMVAQAFASDASRALLPRISGIQVTYGGNDVPAAAYYLAGWAAAVLERELSPSFHADPQLAPGSIGAIELTGAGRPFAVRRVGERYAEIRADALHACASCPVPDELALLGEELRIPGRDPVYDKALRAAGRMAEAAGR